MPFVLVLFKGVPILEIVIFSVVNWKKHVPQPLELMTSTAG